MLVTDSIKVYKEYQDHDTPEITSHTAVMKLLSTH